MILCSTTINVILNMGSWGSQIKSPMHALIWSKPQLLSYFTCIWNSKYTHVQLIKQIYLWRKIVCFVLYLWDPPNRNVSSHVLGVFEKLSMRRGAWAWFHDDWTCGAKVLEYWVIFS
jgi:hypothetical protein